MIPTIKTDEFILSNGKDLCIFDVCGIEQNAIM